MLIKDGTLTLTNVGDSRIYRMRNQNLKQMSLDHSKVQRMISMGLLTPEQARKDPSRHVITQYLGMPAGNQGFSILCARCTAYGK